MQSMRAPRASTVDAVSHSSCRLFAGSGNAKSGWLNRSKVRRFPPLQIELDKNDDVRAADSDQLKMEMELTELVEGDDD